jgi:DNA-directed RNA polymerase specialized sigma24 family protein
MRGHFEADPPVWFWQSGAPGKAVETDLLDAARRTWTRMLSYAQRFQQDPSTSADLLEEILLALSRARRTRRGLCNPIKNLDSYLYVAFVRRLNRLVSREPKIQFVGSLQDLDSFSGIQTRATPPAVEDDVLVRELLQYTNQRTRQMFFLRASGYSWKEVARILRTSANSAQVLFNNGMGKARTRVMKLKGSTPPTGEGRKVDA